MKKAVVIVIVLILVLVGIVAYYFSDILSATFTAEVDGVPLKPRAAYATFSDGWLNIMAADRISGEMRMIVLHLRCSSPGSITLNSDNPRDGYATYSFGKSKDRLTIFSTTSINTGLVTITTLDTNAQRVSGTFEFNGAHVSITHMPLNGNRIVKVTGSFADVPIKNSLRR